MTSEKNQTASTGKEEIKGYFEKLKESPVVSSEHYYVHLSNLCETIKSLSSSAGWTIEQLNDAIKKNELHLRLHYIEDIQKKFWLIMTVADVINEKIMSDDYSDLEDLFYHYGKMKE